MHFATWPEGYPGALPPTSAGAFEDQAAASACAQKRDHLTIPNDKLGVVIGTAGRTIKGIRDHTGAEILIPRRADANGQRTIEISATSEGMVATAKSLLKAIIEPPGRVCEISNDLANLSLGDGGSSSDINQLRQQLSRLAIGESGNVFAYGDMEALIKDVSSLGFDTDGVVGARELIGNGGGLPADPREMPPTIHMWIWERKVESRNPSPLF